MFRPYSVLSPGSFGVSANAISPVSSVICSPSLPPAERDTFLTVLMGREFLLIFLLLFPSLFRRPQVSKKLWIFSSNPDFAPVTSSQLSLKHRGCVLSPAILRLSFPVYGLQFRGRYFQIQYPSFCLLAVVFFFSAFTLVSLIDTSSGASVEQM